MTIDLSDAHESWREAIRAVVNTERSVPVADGGVPTGTMLVPVGLPLVRDARDLLDAVERHGDVDVLLAQSLSDALNGTDVTSTDRRRRLAVAVAELRQLHEAFDIRPDEMTEAFFINAFSQYDTVVRELLDALAAREG